MQLPLIPCGSVCCWMQSVPNTHLGSKFKVSLLSPSWHQLCLSVRERRELVNRDDANGLILWFWRWRRYKSIPVTGREGPYGCKTSRFPHFLENRLTGGGEVVSFTRRPPFTPRKASGTHFCYRLSWPQGHSAAGRIRSIEKSNDLIGIRTRDLPACSTVPQPTTPPRAIVSMPTASSLLILSKLAFIVTVLRRILKVYVT
jgi:hypothetical protein